MILDSSRGRLLPVSTTDPNSKATMRISNKPGESMPIDWAGNKIPFHDSVIDESYPSYLCFRWCPADSVNECYIFGDLE